MSMKKKNKNNQVNKNSKGKEPVFIVEKDGNAYFKDKKLTIICKPSKVVVSPKYPGYMYEFNYKEKLEWFKKLVTLMTVNGGNIKFIGMDLDQFNKLGGFSVAIEGAKKLDSKNLKKMFR